MRPVENKDGTGWHLESVREEAEQVIPASKVREVFDSLLGSIYEYGRRNWLPITVIQRIESARDALLREGGER